MCGCPTPRQGGKRRSLSSRRKEDYGFVCHSSHEFPEWFVYSVTRSSVSSDDDLPTQEVSLRPHARRLSRQFIRARGKTSTRFFPSNQRSTIVELYSCDGVERVVSWFCALALRPSHHMSRDILRCPSLIARPGHIFYNIRKWVSQAMYPTETETNAK